MQRRPLSWAQPIELAGVPNFHKVTESLYRSAQPTLEGMHNLERFGIRTVLNLRLLHSDADEVAGTSLMQDHAHLTAWYIHDQDALWFLDMVATREGAPFLVHCQHGADRTGCMCAMYRMVVQGWPRNEAIREMREGGFGYHELWRNIPTYLRCVDVEQIRHRLAIGDLKDHRPDPAPPEYDDLEGP